MATQPTIQALTDPRYTNVVLWEEHVGAGVSHSRDVVTVTNSAGGTFKQGTILWRVKGEDHTAVWDVVDADADVDVANEYAVLIGDDIEVTETVVLAAATAKKCIALVRRAHLKNKAIYDIQVTALGMSATEYSDLKRLMATQGLLVLDSLTAITP